MIFLFWEKEERKEEGKREGKGSIGILINYTPPPPFCLSSLLYFRHIFDLRVPGIQSFYKQAQLLRCLGFLSTCRWPCRLFVIWELTRWRGPFSGTPHRQQMFTGFSGIDCRPRRTRALLYFFPRDAPTALVAGTPVRLVRHFGRVLRRVRPT